MHHDNSDDSTRTSDVTGRDVLGELIQAAGRRPVPASSDYEKTFTATHTAWQKKVRSMKRRRRTLALAAALAVLAIGAATIMRIVPNAPLPEIATAAVIHGDIAVFSPESGTWQPLLTTGFELTPGDRVRTEEDGRAAFGLGNEISVRLNTNSEIVFSTANSIELVSGFVYIDSGIADSGDLEVLTAHGRLRDIGTQFEVAMQTDGLRVRVREGLVQLYESELSLDFEGSAGEEFRIDAFGTIRQDIFSPYDPEWGWAEALAGPPEVDGMPVLEFLNWVARETGREIRYEGRNVQLAAGTTVLRGSAQNLTPMDALDVMLATTDFVYSVQTDGVIVISRRNQ